MGKITFQNGGNAEHGSTFQAILAEDVSEGDVLQFDFVRVPAAGAEYEHLLYVRIADGTGTTGARHVCGVASADGLSGEKMIVEYGYVVDALVTLSSTGAAGAVLVVDSAAGALEIYADADHDGASTKCIAMQAWSGATVALDVCIPRSPLIDESRK